MSTNKEPSLAPTPTPNGLFWEHYIKGLLINDVIDIGGGGGQPNDDF